MTENQLTANWVPFADVDPRPPVGDTWDRPDWQRLWLGTQMRPWRTLAVVAADSDVSTLEIADLIAGLGLHHGESIDMADVRDVRLDRASSIMRATDEVVAAGLRVVFATRSIEENLATIPIARGVDCVLLCVSLGVTRLACIEETVEHLGKGRFLGSLLLKNTASRKTLVIVPNDEWTETES